MTRDRLLARLHLQAVLPAAAELTAGDFSIELRIDDDLRAVVTAQGGKVRVEAHGEAEVTLQFRDPAALNGLFQEKFGSLPKPTRGWWRVASILRLAGLLQRMGAVLKGDAGVSPQLHAQLAFGVALRALPLLATEDAQARRILAGSPSGAVTLEVPAVGFAASVELSPQGVRFLPERPAKPRARIVVQDLDAALANLAGRADGPAQVALGRVSVTGLLPLADALDALLARVDAYLGPAARAKA